MKPGNVLIAAREHAYLADFGLTKQTSSISGLTGTGELVGTVEYVAPEQIRGEAVDARTDVYALGCVLYECLAGESPFERENEVATLWAHVNEPPPGLGGAIDPVLARALAKNPDERYPSCGELIANARHALGLTAPAAPRRPRSRRAVRVPRPGRRAGAVLVVLAAAVVGAVLGAVLLRGGEPAVTVAPNSVAVIDPATNDLVDAIRTNSAGPSSVAVGDGSVWVANVDDRTLSRIDPETRQAERTVALTATPTDVAVGPGAVWVAYGILGDLVRVDPQRNLVVATLELAGRSGQGSVAATPDVVWAAYGDSTVARIDPSTNGKLSSDFAGAPYAIAIGEGAAWLANWTETTVSRLDERTGALVRPISVAKGPNDIAVGGGAVWVACEADDVVTRIDPIGSSISTIPVGDRPWAIAFGEGSVWVANRGEGTVSRIDPETRRVTDTIEVGYAPAGIAVGEGSVWVSVQAR